MTLTVVGEDALDDPRGGRGNMIADEAETPQRLAPHLRWQRAQLAQQPLGDADPGADGTDQHAAVTSLMPCHDQRICDTFQLVLGV